MACLIVGQGGHAQDIRATVTGFGAHMVAHHALMPDAVFDRVFIGISDPQVRAKVAAEIGVDDERWVHPDARLHGSEVGRGTHVNYGVRMVRTKIGRHSTIAPGVTICGDVVIGDRVLVGAGATICEKVRIEDDAVIGAGAVVLPGRWDTPPDADQGGVIAYNIVPAGETWVGVPARPL